MYLIIVVTFIFSFFFFNDTATTEIYTLSLHDALPISAGGRDLGLRDALLRLARAQGSPDPRRDPRQEGDRGHAAREPHEGRERREGGVRGRQGHQGRVTGRRAWRPSVTSGGGSGPSSPRRRSRGR